MEPSRPDIEATGYSCPPIPRFAGEDHRLAPPRRFGDLLVGQPASRNALRKTGERFSEHHREPGAAVLVSFDEGHPRAHASSLVEHGHDVSAKTLGGACKVGRAGDPRDAHPRRVSPHGDAGLRLRAYRRDCVGRPIDMDLVGGASGHVSFVDDGDGGDRPRRPPISSRASTGSLGDGRTVTAPAAARATASARSGATKTLADNTTWTCRAVPAPRTSVSRSPSVASRSSESNPSSTPSAERPVASAMLGARRARSA